MNKLNSPLSQFILILKLSCFLLFLGRGWQYLFWDGPFRGFFLNEELFKNFIESYTHLSWHAFVINSSIETFMLVFTKAFGVFFLCMALVSLCLTESSKQLGKLLWVGFLCLFLLALLEFMQRQFYLGLLIEHSLQVCAPAIYYLALYHKQNFSKYTLYIKMIIALTFIGHGMFALGIHPVPGTFVDMLIIVLGVSEALARNLLLVAGSLDFIACIYLFIPRTELYGLGFAVIWGTITACARVLAYFDFDLLAMSSHQWILQTLIRLPHGLIPLAMFLYLKNKKNLIHIRDPQEVF